MSKKAILSPGISCFRSNRGLSIEKSSNLINFPEEETQNLLALEISNKNQFYVSPFFLLLIILCCATIENH